jgi:hypothetical protein
MTNNSAKGRNSFDATIGNTVVAFVNRNVSEYPTEAGSVKFDLVPVESQKDLMVNAARMHAQQEYDRIMELVAVLQKQADDIRRRLEITDMVRDAKYSFQTYHGQHYWLVYDTRKDCTRLEHLGPNDWSSSPPENYQYICRIQWLGDHTWKEASE